MNFSKALQVIAKGVKVCRVSWPEGMFVQLEKGVIFKTNTKGRKFRWHIPHDDLFAEDWKKING